MVILVILGIVPGIIVTQLMIGNYKQQAIEVRTGEIRTQCVILCNQIIKENYLNDPNSESINSKLEVLSNAYGGRIMLVDRDFKVVKAERLLTIVNMDRCWNLLFRSEVLMCRRCRVHCW